MRQRNLLLLGMGLFVIPLSLSLLPLNGAEAANDRFHSKAELAHFAWFFPDTLLPNVYNELFAASGTCDPCHGFDTAGIASVDPLGNDINVVDDWRASMMANAAKDPFWRAKVSHEVIVNPSHQEGLEDKCTSCHAPLGRYNAIHTGMTSYSMNDLLSDEAGLDGVSCLACHQQRPEGLGDTHSGELNFDTAAVAFGPYPGPLVSPMALETGWEPVYGPHIQDAGICAGCHTLITETVDLSGNYTGGTFVEQATYHEWRNSTYNEQSISCQSCHMPQLTKGEVYLASGYDTEPRSPFGLHELVGANTLMLQLMKENAEALGINALPEHFDETIARTFDILQNQSLQLDIELLEIAADSFTVQLQLTNLAGHKFPSGYPARRLFIEFLVTDAFTGDTLFASGLTDPDYEVIGHNPTYEPHYTLINQEDQVQIYELVMGDVNGDVTTVLERADHPLKDNRLVPQGFSSSHPVYDTTRIAGQALIDPDFNKDDTGLEGTGSDLIQYQLPLYLANDDVQIGAKVFYQSAPPKWMEEMFAESSPQIEEFRTMFDNADRSPVLIRETSLYVPGLTSTKEARLPEYRIFPNPTRNIAYLECGQKIHLDVYDMLGRFVLESNFGAGTHPLELPEPGLYLLRLQFEDGNTTTEYLLFQ